MKITIWGSRGSLASPGVDTSRYGGNTACVEVVGAEGTRLVLDAGTGIRPLGASLRARPERVDVLLTHLHMDHIQGLGFFGPLRQAGVPVHIWGPASMTHSLRTLLARYLSPPLFPVRLRDLDAELALHELPAAESEIGEFRVSSGLICHPGPTLGLRIESRGTVVTYLTDHEPALGLPTFPRERDWTSGYALAEGADLLIHDAQYTSAEYARRIAWGHSSVEQAVAFAKLAGVGRLVTFHHDPAHSDADLDRMTMEARELAGSDLGVAAASEGAGFEV